MYCILKTHDALQRITTYRFFLLAELWGTAAVQFVQVALHKAFTSQHLCELYIHREKTLGRRGQGWEMMQEQRAEESSSTAGSWHNSVCTSAGYLCLCIYLYFYFVGWGCSHVCVSKSRSLEVACCALICALTVCEHSKRSISTLCGISHRSHLSFLISFCHGITSTIHRMCTCMRMHVCEWDEEDWWPFFCVCSRAAASSEWLNWCCVFSIKKSVKHDGTTNSQSYAVHSDSNAHICENLNIWLIRSNSFRTCQSIPYIYTLCNLRPCLRNNIFGENAKR